jgi:hypothetical protein
MSVFSGPVAARKEYPLLDRGEYVVTLNDLTYETGGTYGDALLWKWLIAPVSSPTDYIARDDGMEKVHHEYTNPDVIIGSKAHEWIAALTGITLGDGDVPPDSDDLLGQRMRVFIGHQAPKQGPNAGKAREKFVQGSAQRFTLAGAKKVAVPQSAPKPGVAEADRAELVKRFEKLVGKAVMLETTYHADYVAINIDATDNATLLTLINQIDAEVKAAVLA